MTKSQDLPYRAPSANPQPTSFLRYPAVALNLTAGALLLIGAPLLYVLVVRFHGRSAHHIVLPLRFLDSAIMLLAAAVTIMLHEYIHGWGLRLHGYQVTYGVHWRKFMAYAAVYDQPIARRHVLRIALAPVVIITVAMLPLLAFPNRYVVLVAFSALLTNTTGSVGDLYLVWHLKYPPQWTLLSDIDLYDVGPIVPGAYGTRVGTWARCGNCWTGCEHYQLAIPSGEQPRESDREGCLPNG